MAGLFRFSRFTPPLEGCGGVDLNELREEN